MVRLEDLARLVEPVTVAHGQLLEENRDRTGALRLGGRPPLAPRDDAEVEEQTLNDNGEKRPEAAAAFEFGEHAVVVFDEFQLDVRPEIVGVGRCKMVPRADECDDALDEIELRQKQSLA